MSEASPANERVAGILSGASEQAVLSELESRQQGAVDHRLGRVLATLEMLQVHGQMTGAELARRLEVDGRTVRKYVETLRDLGMPIEATRGRAGSYRLRPGIRLPPLMFSDDEAVALVLGLLIAQRSGLADEVQIPAVLTKIDRVLPEKTRHRARSISCRELSCSRP